MYCIDFFRKFKKDGNFCGLDKSEVSRLNAYLDVVELLMKQKIPEETVYTHLSVKAARPLLSAKGDERTEALNYVTHQLKEGKKINGTDLQSTMKSWTCPTSEPKAKPVHEKKPEPTKAETSQKKPFAMCYQPGEVPVTDAPPIQSLGESVRKAEMAAAAANQHINNGADVAVNPIIINDTYRQSPNRVVDANKMVSGTFTKSEQAPDSEPTGKEHLTVDPAKTDKELFLAACDEAYKHGKPDFRQAIDALMQYHPSWKTPGDVVYFAVTDPQQAVIKGRK